MRIIVDRQPCYYQNLGAYQIFCLYADERTILDNEFILNSCFLKIDFDRYVTTTGRIIVLKGNLREVTHWQVYKVTVEE